MWPFSKRLSDVIGATKTVRAAGIKFKIRKLNVVHHMEGLNVLIETFSTYDRKREVEKMPQPDVEKMLDRVRGVYRDIFLAAVEEPKLCATKGGQGQFVDDLFGDWDLCHALYQQIMKHTNKKKV